MYEVCVDRSFGQFGVEQQPRLQWREWPDIAQVGTPTFEVVDRLLSKIDQIEVRGCESAAARRELCEPGQCVEPPLPQLPNVVRTQNVRWERPAGNELRTVLGIAVDRHHVDLEDAGEWKIDGRNRPQVLVTDRYPSR